MSYAWTAAVYQLSRSRGPARAVLAALAFHASDDTGECWPSASTLAREAGISVRAVTNALRCLEGLGEITRIGSRNRCIIYRIDLTKSARGAEDSRHVVPTTHEVPTSTSARGAEDSRHEVPTNSQGKVKREEPLLPPHDNVVPISTGKTYAWTGHGKCRLTQEDYDLWKGRFTHIDLDRELYAADAWCVDNPDKAKSWFHVFNRWMERAEDEAVRSPPRSARDGTDVDYGRP